MLVTRSLRCNYRNISHTLKRGVIQQQLNGHLTNRCSFSTTHNPSTSSKVSAPSSSPLPFHLSSTFTSGSFSLPTIDSHRLPLAVVAESSSSYDVIIIGAGMGGSTVGYELSRQGKRVLFLEKGHVDLNRGRERHDGKFAELLSDMKSPSRAWHNTSWSRAGRNIDPMSVNTSTSVTSPSTATHQFISFAGSGGGGSSSLYGMALERFHDSDFDGNEKLGWPTWPIRLQDMIPYYEEAEKMFRVRTNMQIKTTPEELTSTSNTLTPPPLTPAGSELTSHLLSKQLHPYRIPLACEYVPDCIGCQGFLCAKNCKNDAQRCALEPAVKNHQASIVAGALAEKIHSEVDPKSGQTRIKAIEVTDESYIFANALEGKTKSSTMIQVSPHTTVILSLGAINTPALLLASPSPLSTSTTSSPSSSSSSSNRGLGNRTGLVGRNLMRHAIDLWIVFLKNKPDPKKNIKELAWNDLYASSSVTPFPLGTVQSFGRMIPARVIGDTIEHDLTATVSPILGKFYGRFLKPFMVSILGKIFQRGTVIASSMADSPNLANRVVLGDGARENGVKNVSIQYRIPHHDQSRMSTFRRLVKQQLSPFKFLHLAQHESNERLGHACGTTRFGSDPKTSVLDPYCRVWETENLYVVDASFFPTSGGINPALTIAANAIRVARHLLTKHASTSLKEKDLESARPSSFSASTASFPSSSSSSPVPPFRIGSLLPGDWSLVTGASSGIGRAYAERLASARVNVILIARREESLNEFAAQLKQKYNVETLVITIDLAAPSAVDTILQRIADARLTHGIQSIRLLVNAAGIGHWGEFENRSREYYSRMIQLNCTALVSLTEALLPSLRLSVPSIIVNVSSPAGYHPIPYLTVYAASKSFVSSFSRALHEEVRHEGIYVQTLIPGPTESEFDTHAGAPPIDGGVRGPVSAVIDESIRCINSGNNPPDAISAVGTTKQKLFAGLAPTQMVLKEVGKIFCPKK